ncbi:GGDEF domain-containing phosphodiesterase [Bacillus sp. E(2018)]|uniref:bifunctional diguanylate cyclase/phosphodiesterase n=1 Tax=Bacillus sp. E(2018) TaxID=2502239 RepID=UPI0010F48893|nr:GGDEF domain-containing phosphodiesterase [Bacillus sp. E(2018)]
MPLKHAKTKKWTYILAVLFTLHTVSTIGLMYNQSFLMYGIDFGIVVLFAILIYKMLIVKDSYAINLEQEILNHKETFAELEANRVKLQNIFDSIDVAIWSHNLKTNKLLITSGIEKLYGYPLQAFYDDSELWKKVIHPDDDEIINNRGIAIQNGLITTSEYRIMKPNGEIRWIQDRGIPFLDANNELVDFNSILIDITERKRAEITIEHMAYYDELTGLPNRNGFMQAIEKQIVESKLQNRNLALMYVDLDRFNVLNDTLGHSFGDLLLQKVAELLKVTVGYYGTVYRRSGDEFLILLNFKEISEIKQKAKQIIQAFTKPFKLSGQEVFTTPSIGISIYPENGSDSETLLKRADSALYQAKEKGRNTYQFFAEQRDGKMERRLNLEHGLRKALTNKEFFLVYQPLVHIGHNKILGVEALLRWNKEDEGMISPAEFIPIAEETGMILPIGEWVLREACMQGLSWLKNGFNDLLISVNISVRQLLEESFIERVESILSETEFPPASLELEITESTTMQNMEEALPILNALRTKGIRISVDDFGTGYSSLTYLRHLPVDTLKIDKMFIDDILTDQKAGAIVKTIIDMGHNLDFHVIAEGIESREQIDFLVEQGCIYGQGYHLHKPLHADELEKQLHKNVVMN